MIHELRFTDTYQPGVMFAYMGPHAGDPELNAAIEEDVHDLQAILNSEHARALDVNSIGNIVTFKGSRLQILLESSVPTNGSLPRDDAMTVYGEADGCLWTPLWDGLGKKPTRDAHVRRMQLLTLSSNLTTWEAGVETAKKSSLPVAIVSGCGRYPDPMFEVLAWLPSATAKHRAHPRLPIIAGLKLCQVRVRAPLISSK